MPPSLSPQEFVAKWRSATLKESAGSQEHFLDVCRLVGHPTPAEADPAGHAFTFEAGAEKLGGGEGFADVWKRGFFAWEYKGKHADLDKAYEQLQRYRESLENPPLLVVSDMERILVHTNFTNTAKRVLELDLDALLTPEGLGVLRDVFTQPATGAGQHQPKGMQPVLTGPLQEGLQLLRGPDLFAAWAVSGPVQPVARVGRQPAPANG